MPTKSANLARKLQGARGIKILVLIGLLFLGVAGCRTQEADPAVTVVEGQVAVPEVTSIPTSESIEPLLEPTETTVPTPATEESAVPFFNGENMNLSWTYESGDAINHPPLRVGDSLIVVPKDGPLLALDAETGNLRWQYDPGKRIWDRAYATDGRSIFVGIEGGQLAALDVESGEVNWQTDLGIDVQVPPFVAGDVIYVPSTFVGPGLESDPQGKAKIFALNNRDGQEIWQFESENYILQTPFVLDDTVYAAGVYYDPQPVDEGGHTRLYALNAKDGSEKWAYETLDGFPKQLYATDTAVAYIAYTDFISGVDAASGELLWRRDTGNWVPTLSGADDTVYFGSANTVVHALDIHDGSVLWQHNIAEGTFNYVLGAPVRSGEDLLFLTQQGDIIGISADDGALRWHFPTEIAARTGLTVYGDWLYIGDDQGVVYAYKTN